MCMMRGKPAAFPRGPTAWLASPPSGGRKEICEAIGFPDVLRVEETTPQMPFPVFRSRARGKQWFSSIIATMAVEDIVIKLQDSFQISGAAAAWVHFAHCS